MRKFGKLREKIKLVFGTQKAFAEAMGVHSTTMNAKLNSKVEWTSNEIEKVCALLNIPTEKIQEYFFY